MTGFFLRALTALGTLVLNHRKLSQFYLRITVLWKSA